jgi:hypothetical protein
MNSNITDPQQLWDDICVSLIFSLYHMVTWGYFRNDLFAKANSEIDKIIQRNNPHERMAEPYHISPPQPDAHSPHESDLAPPQDLGDLTSMAGSMADRLNPEQPAAYDAIIRSILNQEGKQFFLDGPGGTGKVFLQLHNGQAAVTFSDILGMCLNWHCCHHHLWLHVTQTVGT